MKRMIVLVLLAAMCLALCACGVDKAAVEQQLQGAWGPEDSSATHYFEDGRFAAKVLILDPREGSYEITGSKIKLHFDNGVDAEIKYTFRNGELSLDGFVKK